MPILEGLDCVQKMSKSYGNAIGIKEPPLEMYGKLMSISDEMMWRYYELLTDVQIAGIETMKREAHPMQAKKELAGRIVADFHSAEAAAKAGEDWTRQFQKDEVPEDISSVTVKFADILNIAVSEVSMSYTDGRAFLSGGAYKGVRLDKLLVLCGLAKSTSEASRKIKEGAVVVGSHVHRTPYFLLEYIPQTLSLRLGKRVAMANIVPA